ncbi:MAG: helix-turn-helix domain-containing protein [Steroidobacteraceae bacterium]
MDSLITAAARALAAGDPLGALKRVALRDDPPALALRGIAMAQLGDLARARALVRRAARAFGSKEVVARARCVVAEAEIALAARELAWPVQTLAEARSTLEAHGDRVNATHARYLAIRRLLLIGHIDEAQSALAGIDPVSLPAAVRATHELVLADIAARSHRAGAARDALGRATQAAREARIPALAAEVERASLALESPAARWIAHGAERLVRLAEIEALFASTALVVDARRHVVRDASGAKLLLARRPVLFTLVRVLAETWPGDASREALVARAFRARHADESHRARLRVEIGRLRAALRGVARITATRRGFALAPRSAREVIVLARTVEEPHARALALLADGESWSSSALALALGASQRTVQRSLESLAARGRVQSFGRGRARRWMTPPAGVATMLLLPAPLPDD